MLIDSRLIIRNSSKTYPGKGCFFILACLFIILAASSTASAWLIEADSISLPAVSAGSTTFQSITFRQVYPSKPVVVLLPGDENPEPGAIRIRNITTTGFEITQTEPPGENGTQPASIIHYIAVEPGSHQLPNGSRIEAATININNVQHGTGVGGPESWATINFSTSFTSQPAVLGQIQSMNNESGNPPGSVSIPWLTTTIQSVTTSSMQIAVERSEVNDGGNSVANETVGYLAIDSGTSGNFIDNSSNNIDFETIRSAQNIRGWNDGCFSSNFSNSYSSTPLVAASANTHAGGDGGWLRRCSISTSAIGLSIDEDQDRDSERNHTYENAGIAVFSSAFDADLTPPPPVVADTAWRMESGEINMPAISLGDTAFNNVTFKQYYSSAPLVFVLPRNENNEPASVRINNITNTGFEIVPVEPPGENGAQPATTVHYLAIDPGLHQLPDGTIIEALTKSTTKVQSNPSAGSSWESIIFSNAFAATPSILAQVQTLNNETNAIPGTPSDPWLMTTVQNVTPTGFQLALERAETGIGSVPTSEVIGYLAIAGGSSGSFTDNDGLQVNYEAIRSANSIAGWSNGCYQINFSGSYTSPVVLASQNQRAGNNGGWIRRCSIAGTNVGLTVDEDQTNDSERAHITERAGILVFGQPFVVDFALEAWWPMEEPLWDGTPNEVMDWRSNGHDGQAINGPTTTIANPAIAGDPGTCGYGVFDGNDDYIQLPGFPDFTSDFTITGWFNTTKHNEAGQRIFADDENNSGGYALSVGDPSTGRLRFFSRGTSPVSLDTPNNGPSKISKNKWYFVAAVADITNTTKSIYVYDEFFNQITTVSGGYTGTWGTDAGMASIGGETNSGETSYRFNGNLDEVRIYNKSLSVTEIIAVMQESHQCSFAGVNHYSINHSGSGINCEAEPVTISAHDAAHTVLTGHIGTINLSTSTSHGDWSVISGNPSNLVNNGNGDGIYTFDGSESGSVVLGLRDTFIETVNIDITDGTATELTGTAIISEDNSIDFFEAGFKFLIYPDANNDNVPDSATLETVNTQISGKQSDQGWNDQIIRIQAIKTDDETGACVAALNSPLPRNTQMKITYLSPASPSGNPPLKINGKDLPISWTDMTDMTDLTFTAGVSGDIYLLYQDAGQLSLEIQHDTDGDGTYEMVGINNPTLTVHPFAFLVTATGNPAANLPTGLGYTRAGTDFTVNTTAVQWQAADDTNNNGIADGHDDTDPTNNADLTDNQPIINFGQETVPENIVLSALLNQPAGGNDPGLSGTTTISTFINGSGNTAAASYDEVGIIEISAHIADGDYLGVGAISTSNIIGRSGYVGRFTPDHFILTINPDPPTFSDACLLGGYTYLGETFNFATNPEITITAFNAAPLNAITQNYDCGGFWKFNNPMNLGYTYSDSSGSGLALIPATNTENPLAGDTTDCTGTVQIILPDSITYVRPSFTAPTAPFAASIDLTMAQAQLTDSDLICYDTGAGCQDFTKTNITGTILHHGKIQVFNNFGPETENIFNSPFEAQYFDGANWITHLSNYCSTGLVFCSSPATNRVNSIQPSPLSSGQGTFTVTTSGTSGEQLDVCTTSPTWLTDLSNCSTPDKTCGKFTFGIYRGNDRIINWIERVR